MDSCWKCSAWLESTFVRTTIKIRGCTILLSVDDGGGDDDDDDA